MNVPDKFDFFFFFQEFRHRCRRMHPSSTMLSSPREPRGTTDTQLATPTTPRSNVSVDAFTSQKYDSVAGPDQQAPMGAAVTAANSAGMSVSEVHAQNVHTQEVGHFTKHYSTHVGYQLNISFSDIPVRGLLFAWLASLSVAVLSVFLLSVFLRSG